MPATEWIRVTSSASSSPSGGRIPGSRRASIVLPVPGRPGEQQVVRSGRGDLEHPSRALLPADVGEVGRRPARRARAVAARAAGSGGVALAAEVRDRLGEVRERAPARRRRAPTSRAGLGGADERVEPGAPRALGGRERAGTGRSRPSSASSPTAAWPASASRGIWRDAASTASAIGRSKPEPSLRSPAGARLTVIRRSGQFSSADAIPLRTRCFASWQARSARPTIANAGTPRCEVRLDLDPARLEPDECVGDGAREHAATRRRRRRTCLCRLCDESQTRRATSTSSKNSPARRPVRRLTCRR